MDPNRLIPLGAQLIDSPVRIITESQNEQERAMAANGPVTPKSSVNAPCWGISCKTNSASLRNMPRRAGLLTDAYVGSKLGMGVPPST